MPSSGQTLPFKVSTYKLNFHDANSSREGLRTRILNDAATDVWCLQGVNLTKQLKSLPPSYANYPSNKQAFVYNTERVLLAEKHSVNLIPPLLTAADAHPSIADTFCLSRFHLSKLQVFAAFAAFDVLPPTADGNGGASSPNVALAVVERQSAAQRILVVNVDLERFRDAGDGLMCHLLEVLFRLIWHGNRSYCVQWRCTHVCLAGSFFFLPRSAPYELCTALSGGRLERRMAQVLVPPFRLVLLDDSDESDKCEEDEGTVLLRQMCVLAVETQGGSCCCELFGLRVGNEAAEPVSALSDVRLSLLDETTGEHGAAERLHYSDEEQCWLLPRPRDTSGMDRIVARLQWSRKAKTEQDDGEAAPTPAAFAFCVRSFGVLPPERQVMDGIAVGTAVLRSANAGTVSLAAAAEFYDALRGTGSAAVPLMVPLGKARLRRGEPVITALYRADAGVAPGCYDYIFVSAASGVEVCDGTHFSLDDFVKEPATPHLPVSCSMSIPCGR